MSCLVIGAPDNMFITPFLHGQPHVVVAETDYSVFIPGFRQCHARLLMPVSTALTPAEMPCEALAEELPATPSNEEPTLRDNWVLTLSK